MPFTNRTIATAAGAVALALGPAVGVAAAKHGADDPPGHVRGADDAPGHVRGADDAPGHIRHGRGADDSATAQARSRAARRRAARRRAAVERRRREAERRHGADDGPNHR